MNSTQKLHY